MSYVNVLLFTSAIVVALMAMYAYDNKRRMVEILAKLDRSDELDATRTRVQKSADEAILLKTKLTDVQRNADEKSEMVVDLQEQLKTAETTTNEVKQHILDLRENLEQEKSKHKDTRKELEEAKHELDNTRARVKKSADEVILLKTKLTDVQKNADEKSEMVVDLQKNLEQEKSKHKDTRKELEQANQHLEQEKSKHKDTRKELKEAKQHLEQEKSKHKDTRKELEQAKHKRPSDCMDLDKSTSKSGIYKIYPEKTTGFNVFCEMEEHGGGWTVFQRRMNGKINFNRNWESYKTGFGNMNEEHWLGNEHLHQLTSQGEYMIRVDMSDFENNFRFAEYSEFSIGSETSGYKLHVTGYSGNAGDAMEIHNGYKFTTKDKDNDKSDSNCALLFNGGWWYEKCHFTNLNGLYLKGRNPNRIDGVTWYHWKGYEYSLQTTTMMIRKI